MWWITVVVALAAVALGWLLAARFYRERLWTEAEVAARRKKRQRIRQKVRDSIGEVMSAFPSRFRLNEVEDGDWTKWTVEELSTGGWFTIAVIRIGWLDEPEPIRYTTGKSEDSRWLLANTDDLAFVLIQIRNFVSSRRPR
ncbi:MAG: hypothetical protein AAB686_02255 [Patescibacteria group bacterium]